MYRTRKNIFIAFFSLLILCVFILSACTSEKGENICASEGCNHTKVSGSDYCYDHRCPADECTNSKNPNSKFCYQHTEGTGTIPEKTAIIVKPRSVEDKGDCYWFNVGFHDTDRVGTIFYGVLTIYNANDDVIYIGSTGIITCGANKYAFHFISVKKSDIVGYNHYVWQALAAEPSKLGKQ